MAIGVVSLIPRGVFAIVTLAPIWSLRVDAAFSDALCPDLIRAAIMFALPFHSPSGELLRSSSSDLTQVMVIWFAACALAQPVRNHLPGLTLFERTYPRCGSTFTKRHTSGAQ
jgi:hypothetical protein